MLVLVIMTYFLQWHLHLIKFQELGINVKLSMDVMCSEVLFLKIFHVPRLKLLNNELSFHC
jgi:hypothetical protein